MERASSACGGKKRSWVTSDLCLGSEGGRNFAILCAELSRVSEPAADQENPGWVCMPDNDLSFSFGCQKDHIMEIAAKKTPG